MYAAQRHRHVRTYKYNTYIVFSALRNLGKCVFNMCYFVNAAAAGAVVVIP